MHLRLLLRYVKLLCHWKLFFLFKGEVVPGSSLQKVFTQFMIQRKIRVGGTSFYVDYLKHTGSKSPKDPIQNLSNLTCFHTAVSCGLSFTIASSFFSCIVLVFIHHISLSVFTLRFKRPVCFTLLPL